MVPRATGCAELIDGNVRCWLGALFFALLATLTSQTTRASDLRIGATEIARSADPHYAQGWGERLYFEQIYEGMVDTDGHTKLVPVLAARWERTDNGWLFHLRRDVRFQNGRPLTPKDVIFSLCRAQSLPDAPRTYTKILAGVQAVTTVDAGVLIHMAGGDQSFPLAVATIPIVSAPPGSNWQFANPACTGKGGIDSAAFANPALRAGTGPYQLSSFSEDRITLVRSPTFRGGDLAWKRVDMLRMNENALVRGILDRTLDIVYTPPASAIEFVGAQGGVDVHHLPSTAITYLMFNWRSTSGVRLADIRVRRAIAMAIPRNLLAQRFMPGLVTPTGQIALPGSADRAPTIPDDEYDPVAAKKLLAEAGYPNGVRVNLLVGQAQYKVAKVLAHFLSQVGIQADVREEPPDVTTARRRAGDYDIYCMGRVFNAADMPEAFHTLLGGTGSGRPAGERNYGGYSNLAFDKLVAQARAATDDKARNQLLRKVAELAYSEAAWAPVFHSMSAWIVRKGIRIEPRLDRSLRLDKVTLLINEAQQAGQARSGP